MATTVTMMEIGPSHLMTSISNNPNAGTAIVQEGYVGVLGVGGEQGQSPKVYKPKARKAMQDP